MQKAPPGLFGLVLVLWLDSFPVCPVAGQRASHRAVAPSRGAAKTSRSQGLAPRQSPPPSGTADNTPGV